ncbi:hypothetical protein EHQ58_10840 [Leptospira ognonensis]|uniref:Uncharacterized protein n=1 Tax=Leptospira ognonensis TaxID=2484945 RepID=A0A4R9K144_9LEPT|nr:hypothetical protein [Leptospira ognonensis]TGL57896.1 hypothetical protein EHQ58_10840 [Leptospira ognonensis]
MSRFILLFTLILYSVGSLFSEENSVAAVKATSGYYIVTYKNSGVNLEIFVNGYAVKEGGSTEDSSGQADVNYWIIPGKNTLSYRLTERRLTGKKKETPFPPEAEINLTIGQQGQFPDEGERLFSYTWQQQKESIGEWVHLSFDPPFLPPSKLWSVAQTIEWSPELESAAITHLEALTKALNSKDPNKVLPFLSFREKDTAEARYYPADPASEKKALSSMMKSIGPTWKLSKNKMKVTLLCGNKIVTLTDAKGNSLLNAKKDASIPIYLSLIDGKWVITR